MIESYSSLLMQGKYTDILYTVYPDYRTPYERKEDAEVEIVKCPFFTTSLLELTAPFEKKLDDCGDFLIVICMEGTGPMKLMTTHI